MLCEDKSINLAAKLEQLFQCPVVHKPKDRIRDQAKRNEHYYITNALFIISSVICAMQIMSAIHAALVSTF